MQNPNVTNGSGCLSLLLIGIFGVYVYLVWSLTQFIVHQLLQVSVEYVIPVEIAVAVGINGAVLFSVLIFSALPRE